MKNIFLGLLAIALMSSPAFAANGGGKKKSQKKAKTECRQVKDCDPKNCDPKCCDLSTCIKDQSCTKEQKCSPTASGTGNK
ncbi:MAG TPA: hypothetical protein VGQ53_24810 [Chitinophagaceae bacterium]|jgi:hypothetical protein|nr:hypothetical protein [Chitinophagaceae bacterium]